MSVMSHITLVNVLETFFRMEVDEDLFSKRLADGTFYWDVIRRDVYLCLHSAVGGPFASPVPPAAPTWRSRTKDVLKPFINALSRSYLTRKSPNWVFITLQRVKSGSRLTDNITDHLYELLAERAVAIELMNRQAIHFTRLLTGGKTRVPRVAIRSTRHDSEAASAAGFVQDAIRRHFGITLEVDWLICGGLSLFRQTRDYYRKLFTRLRPKAFIGVNDGSLNGLYCAASEAGVATVELQHGASLPHTIFWSYPPGIPPSHPGLSLPTAYFTWSDHWNRNTHLPVKLLRTIGTDYFHVKPIDAQGQGVLVISSYMYIEVLLALAKGLAKLDPERVIFFKLHPHEFQRKPELVLQCRSLENLRIIGDELEFSQLLEQCGHVVAVQSTAVYLALQSRKRVCLLRHSNYFWHEDVFRYVELFDTAAELADIIADRDGSHFPEHALIPDFFQPYSADAFRRALDDVLACVDRAPAGNSIPMKT